MSYAAGPVDAADDVGGGGAEAWTASCDAEVEAEAEAWLERSATVDSRGTMAGSGPKVLRRDDLPASS